MAISNHWKLVIALTMLVVIGVVGIFDIMDDIQAGVTQRAQHECKSNTTNCAPNTHCYGNDTFYECMCISGWDGDGFLGDGHSGCQRRQLSKSQLAAFIIAFILAALLVLWFLVDAIWVCLRLIARIRNHSQVPLAQQAYPHQGVALGVVEAL